MDTDLTMLDGRLFATSTFYNEQRVELLEIDTVTGSATFLGNLSCDSVPIKHAEGLTSRDGSLLVSFTTAHEKHTESLGTLSLDGAVSDYAHEGVDMDGLAADTDGTLFAIDTLNNPPQQGVHLWTVQPAESRGTLLFPEAGITGGNDIDFLDGELFVLAHNQRLLAKIDKSNGQLIHTTTLDRDGKYLGLAAVPEPSVALLVLAGVVLLTQRRFRREVLPRPQ